jgi:hypothetical protein
MLPSDLACRAAPGLSPLRKMGNILAVEEALLRSLDGLRRDATISG